MTAELVVASPTDLASVAEAQREVAVTVHLADARDRLALALHETGPEAVAAIRAEMATVAEMTKQLGLSKEIRDDATEMVRRSEYALGKAIRAGQAAGTIRAHGQQENRGNRYTDPRELRVPEVSKASPYDYATNAELYGDQRGAVGGNGIYALAEATEDEFEEAITRARDEENVSRANTVRKVREVRGGEAATASRWERVAELAAEGHTSDQISRAVGILAVTIRRRCRELDIDIPADRVRGKRARLNSDRILAGVADSLSAATFSIQQIDPLELDQETAREQVDSLTESLAALRKAVRQIKESI